MHVHLHVDVPTISAPPAPARQPRAGAAAGVIILVFARTNYFHCSYPMTRIKTRTMRNSERALTAVTVGVQCGICIFESAPCIRLFYALCECLCPLLYL